MALPGGSTMVLEVIVGLQCCWVAVTMCCPDTKNGRMGRAHCTKSQDRLLFSHCYNRISDRPIESEEKREENLLATV